MLWSVCPELALPLTEDFSVNCTLYSFWRVTVTCPYIAPKIDPCHDLKSYFLVFEFQVTMTDITSLPQFVCCSGSCGYHGLGRSQKCYVLEVPHTHKQPHTHTHTHTMISATAVSGPAVCDSVFLASLLFLKQIISLSVSDCYRNMTESSTCPPRQIFLGLHNSVSSEEHSIT